MRKKENREFLKRRLRVEEMNQVENFWAKGPVKKDLQKVPLKSEVTGSYAIED